MKRLIIILSAALILTLLAASCGNKTAFKALIITGQGQHGWQYTSGMVKKILDETGLFRTNILQTPPKGSDMGSFKPQFTGFNVVIVDYNGDEWPEQTKKAFIDYVSNGGGVIICQSAGSAFPGWKEYGDICGYRAPLSDNGKFHEFEIRMAGSENPIVTGLSVRWLHVSDILQSNLTGPAENTQVLATAFSDTASGGSGKNEPVLIAVKYGKGRVFHTTLGSPKGEDDPVMKCSGFITTLQRGAEWTATGNITQKVPDDFPSAANTVIRPELKGLTHEEEFRGMASYQIDRSTKYLTGIQAWIREAHGDTTELMKIEHMMIDLLRNKNASDEGKKLILHELSWIGTERCVSTVKEMALNPELKDEADFALERLKTK